MPRHQIKDSPLLQKARERFKLANDADSEQAQRERDDLAFYAGDQWPADIRTQRMGQQPQNGMPSVPARPTLVINKVREPIRQVQNEIRDSDIGVELTPANDFGDLGITPDDAEIATREGLLRRTQRDSDAQEARNWAGDRADIAGRGYYLVMTRFLPGMTWDQEIYVERIYNQAAVLLDPSHTQPDGSDADWGFIGTWVSWDRYKAEYGTLADGEDNPFTDYSESDFMGLTEDYPTWYKADGDHRSVRIVDYWYTEREARELAMLSDGQVAWVDELPKGERVRGANGKWKKGGPVPPDGTEIVDTRTVVEKSIRFCKIGGGVQELEKTEWAGPDLPIIEVVGEELHPYDDQRRIEGMVRNARGAQQGTNYLVSKFVETVGLAPIPRDTVDPDSIAGYEAWWEAANTRTLPYRPQRTYDDNGKPYHPPTPGNADPNILPIAQGIAMFDQFVKSTTAVPDQTLGNVDPSLKSGRAIRETVMNAKGSTSNFLTNRIRSMKREATVVNNLLYPIYGARPGRLLRVINGEGQPDSMMLGDEQGQAVQQGAKAAKLTKDATFNVAIKVTKNFDTRRQQEAGTLGEQIAANPEFMTWFGDLYFQASDIPNRKQLAERAKVMLAPPIQQMLQSKEQNQAPIPPEVQQQMAQMSEQLQAAEAAIQELAKEREGKLLEQQGKAELARIQADRDVQLETVRQDFAFRIAEMNNATKMYDTDVKAKTQGVLQAQEAEHEAIALAHTQQHEAEQTALDHDNLERQEDRASEEAERDRAFQSDEAERGRQATAAENEANRDASSEAGQ